MNRRITEALGAAACALILALPVAAASGPAAPRSVWPAETLSGKVMMVDPAQHLLVMKGPSGVPFDMTVTGSTSVRADGQRTTLSNLSSDVNQNVTVRFVPERAGDVARSVRVTG